MFLQCQQNRPFTRVNIFIPLFSSCQKKTNSSANEVLLLAVKRSHLENPWFDNQQDNWEKSILHTTPTEMRSCSLKNRTKTTLTFLKIAEWQVCEYEFIPALPPMPVIRYHPRLLTCVHVHRTCHLFSVDDLCDCWAPGMSDSFI